MLVTYVVAAVVAGTAALLSARHPRLAYWSRWDLPALVVALSLICAIDAVVGVAVATVGVHAQWEPVSGGSARQWANGALYGLLGFLLLRLEINSFGLDTVSPARLLRKLFVERIGPVLDEAAQRSVARKAGDLRPRQLGKVSWRLFKAHVAGVVAEDVAREEGLALRALRRVAEGEQEEQAVALREDPLEAQEDLRIYIQELIIEHADSTVDLGVRGHPKVADQHDASRASAVTHTVLGPAVALVTVGVAIWQLAMGRTEAVALAAVALALTATLLVLWAIRRRRLRGLLQNKRRRMRNVTMADLNVRRDDRPSWAGSGASPSNPSPDDLAEALGSRRLVLLVGDRLSGRSRTAFEALQAECANYVLLRPVRSGDVGRPPLTTLLTSGVLSLRRRYVLWLDDVGGFVEAGLDPRIIERWLAGGLGRVAVGTITPAELERLDAAGTPAWVPLQRAVQLPFQAPHTPPPDSAAARYRDMLANDPEGAAVARIVATFELLQLAPPSEESARAAYENWADQSLSPETFGRLYAGSPALLSLSDDVLSADREVARIVEGELRDKDGIALLRSLIVLVEGPDLVTLAAALLARRAFDFAERAFGRAEEIGDDDVQLAVTGARTRLADLRAGVASGATLSNIGGLDFPERMGPLQRAAAIKRLAEDTDEVFDSTLPPDEESWTSRFYRLTVYRGLVRVGVLAVLDTTAVAVAAVAALAVRAAAQHRSESVVGEDFLKLLVPGSIVVVAIAVSLGLYRGDAARARPQQLLGTMAVFTTVVAAGFLVAGVDVGSLAALAALFAVGLVATCMLRYGYDRISRRWVRRHHLRRRILVLGSRQEARACAKDMVSCSGRPVQIVAFMSPRRSTDEFCVGVYAQLNDDFYAEFDEILRDLHIAELVIVDRWLAAKDKASLIDFAQSKGVDVRYLAKDEEIILGTAGRVDDHGLVYSPAALITPEAVELKRATDAILAVLTLPVWGGIIAIYALYSKLRRRGQPIFVTAERIGLGTNSFAMLRLRTRLKHPDGSRGAFASGRVEEWFERTGLDEIPQVLNVLRQDMSLVGPRPLDSGGYAELTTTQRRTLGARPGLTGRWQVAQGYGASESHGRAMDADYLRRWRVTHDMELMIRTPLAILRRGFYLGDTRIAQSRR